MVEGLGLWSGIARGVEKMEMGMGSWWHAFRHAVDQRCHGHSWAAYGLLWLVITFPAVLVLECSSTCRTPVYWLNVAIHESGHFVTLWWAPTILHVAAGTLFQWGAPIVCGWLLWRQGEPFSVPVALVWLGMSFNQSVSYIADASTQALPPLSVGNYQPTIHDWNYLLGLCGLLGYEDAIAQLCRGLAIVAMLAGITSGAWIVWRMRVLSRAPHAAAASAPHPRGPASP